MKTSSVEFISRSPTPSPMNSNYRRFSSGLHGSTAADSVQSGWPFVAAKAQNSLRAQVQQKPKLKLLDIRAELERRENARAILGSIPIRRFCVRRPLPGRPRATTPAEDRFLALSARRRRTTTVPQLVADHFQASGRRISLLRECEIVFFNAGLYARRPVVASTDLEEQRTRYHQSKTVERHSYRGGGILVWAGISLGGHTDLHVFHGGTITGLRYRDEILDPYVRPYTAAIGNDFILMDDNARPHRAGIVEEYLKDHVLERMEWPARSPDLNR
ncbi:transposable element Tcb2 transposase [Trichonephila clavipes]|nr:transposable element Tcb2 transposase [Trichonephila clavipes]